MKPTEAISFGFKVEFLSIIASVMAAKKEIAIEAAVLYDPTASFASNEDYSSNAFE